MQIRFETVIYFVYEYFRTPQPHCLPLPASTLYRTEVSSPWLYSYSAHITTLKLRAVVRTGFQLIEGSRSFSAPAPPDLVFLNHLPAGDSLPPPHSTCGGCGLPPWQMPEKLRSYNNGAEKFPDPSGIYMPGSMPSSISSTCMGADSRELTESSLVPPNRRISLLFSFSNFSNCL